MKSTIRIWLAAATLASAAFAPAALAQTETPAAPAAPPQSAPSAPSAQSASGKSKKAWTIKVDKEHSSTIQLAAKEAPLTELASDLADKLGVPVRLSGIMQNHQVTAELTDATVEETMRALAPQVYLDEIVNVQNASTRKLLAVYLSGLNEPTPARHASLKEQTETVLFMGNIAGEGEDAKPEENPLQVKVENGYLTIRARRQPVSVVVYEIAQQLGLSFELQPQTEAQPEAFVDLDLQSYRLEDVLRQLPVPVQLMRRTNLSQGESEPLRIILLGLLAQNGI